VLGGVQLALFGIRLAHNRAGLDRRAEDAEIRLGLPDQDAARGVADLGAVEAEATGAKQLLCVRLSKVGVRHSSCTSPRSRCTPRGSVGAGRDPERRAVGVPRASLESSCALPSLESVGEPSRSKRAANSYGYARHWAPPPGTTRGDHSGDPFLVRCPSAGRHKRREQPAGRAADDDDPMSARPRAGTDLPGPTDSSKNRTLWIEAGSLRRAGGVVDRDRANATWAHPGDKRRVLAVRYRRCETNKPNRARSGGGLDRQRADCCRHKQRERKGPQGIAPSSRRRR
jgi:hypothetical protein